MDKRVDTLDTYHSTQKQRLDILAQMNSPENLRREHMATAKMQADIDNCLT